MVLEPSETESEKEHLNKFCYFDAKIRELRQVFPKRLRIYIVENTLNWTSEEISSAFINVLYMQAP